MPKYTNICRNHMVEKKGETPRNRGFKGYDKSTIRLPRQHLPLADG